MIKVIIALYLLCNMQRTSLFMSIMLISLCFSNLYAVSAEDSETDDCWVIIKENYEWVTEDEEMAAMHSMESNLSYDSQCRLFERTDTTSDSLHHKFISYNEDSTISNTSLYWYDSDGDVIYLWQETFAYQGDLVSASTWTEFSNNGGNYSLNQEQHTLYSYDSQGREILTNTSHGESSYTVESTYDDSGNLAKVDSSTNGELSSSIEYEYDATNVLTSETLTNIYGSSQFSKTTNYSYDDSGKLVSKEQHDEPNNWTIYWNYTYDERGNKIIEEYSRTGNSWGTITTFTWNYGNENAGISPDVGSSAEESTSNTWLVLLLIILILATAYMVFTRSKVDAVRTLTDIDTDKIVEEILEEE